MCCRRNIVIISAELKTLSHLILVDNKTISSTAKIFTCAAVDFLIKQRYFEKSQNLKTLPWQ